MQSIKSHISTYSLTKGTIAMMYRLLKSILFIIVITYACTASAQDVRLPKDSLPANDHDFVYDNFVVSALDSLANLKFFENTANIRNSTLQNKYNFLPNFVPTYNDSVYYTRIEHLNTNSPMDLVYNKYVRDFINLYAVKKRGLTSRVLGLTQVYFPMIEQDLDMYDIPQEMKYLAIVESALNANARSPVGASGLWQFMLGTGKMYDLNVSSYVDDRLDPYKATVAACRHFKDLYRTYHDWLLVLAAYNSGAGNVNKAIRRSGGKMNFWEIRNYLPRETRDYVPAFIAVNYVMNYSAEHNLYPTMPNLQSYEIDTVAVKYALSFAQISEKLKISTDDLMFLNPSFRKGFIPSTKEKTYFIRLPKKSVADFINNETALYAYSPTKGYDASQFQNLIAQQSSDDASSDLQRASHKVRRGESLATIARKYHCTTSDIKEWNGLKRSKVSTGQRLTIYTAKLPKKIKNSNEAAQVLRVSRNTTEEVQPVAHTKYHVVKKGEFLGKIASKYNVSLDNLKKWNHLKSANVQVGQNLKVSQPQPASAEMNTEIASSEDKNRTQARIKAQEKDIIKYVYYTVQPGDTLWKIAQKYEGVSVSEIKDLNNITNDKGLKVGQKIKVAVAG
ncbi:MAG TPA: LysM peptidoglycan-binding domain-containing protein [Bacteroidales bacterium]